MAKKPSLSLMMAVAPASRNSNGVKDSSISSPDQGTSSLSEAEEPMVEEEQVEQVSEPMENAIMLPPGFKPPEGSEGGGLFSTTVKGRVMGNHLMVESLGDMPIKGGTEEVAEETQVEQPDPMADAGENVNSPELSADRKKRAAEKEARDVFQKRY